MFSHCNQYNVTASAAEALQNVLDGNLLQPLHSSFKTENDVKELSDLKAGSIHMCRNSCCAFDGPYSDMNQCPFCKLPWRDRKGHPYKTFQPIPLIPRLQAMYANPSMAAAMRYRANYHNSASAQSTTSDNERSGSQTCTYILSCLL